MSSFADFLGRLFDEGEITYREAPPAQVERDRAAADVLERAFADHRLHVAGPPIAYDANLARAAGLLVWQAGWFLFSRQETESELDRRLVLPGPPDSAAAHLSADLALRYLPQIHRRAEAVATGDHLVERLSAVLRSWPLSGVLASVREGPTTPVEFEGHPGLLLLYAERLARHEKAAWVPAGPAFEYVELVYTGLGKKPPARPASEEVETPEEVGSE